MGIYEDALDAIRKAVNDAGSTGELARYSDVSKSSIVRWANGSNRPRLEDIAPLLDHLGYELRKSGEPYFETSEDEDFISVPILKDPSRYRRGFLPANNIAGWCKVERNFASVICGNCFLVVVQVKDDAMQPTLPAGSLVLVDTDISKSAVVNSRMYLCRDARTGAVSVRRISLEETRKDTRIIISNDDRSNATARIYSLNRDYDGDILNAVIGRCTWARTSIWDK